MSGRTSPSPRCCAIWGSAHRKFTPKTAEHGFLLIEDFGDDVYTRLLARGADEGALYALAIDTLAALHRAVAERGRPALPPYDEARLLDEAALLADWYAPSVLGAALPDAARDEYLARWRQILPLAALPRRRRWCCAIIMSTI